MTQLPPSRTAPADQAGMRRANLSLVLRHLLAAGPQSRAGTAAAVGLTKATVSSLVVDLAARRLLREEGRTSTGAAGRPGRLLHVAEGTVVGLGILVTTTGFRIVVRDLAGTAAAMRVVPCELTAIGPDRAVHQLADVVRAVLKTSEDEGRHVSGVTVAVPGMVDRRGGTVLLAPNLDWHDVPLVAQVRTALGRDDVPVAVDNDATLGALAEHACGGAAGAGDLVVVMGDTGVGVGVVSEGHILQGARGLAGELAHTPLGDPSRRCGCGRWGCWETDVGLPALLAGLASGVGPAEVASLAAADDPAAVAAVRRVGDGLGRGAAVLVNVLNPAVIVLGGYFAALGPPLVHAVTRALADQVAAPEAGGCVVRASTLGPAAPSIGGAIRALRRVVDDPTSVPAP